MAEFYGSVCRALAEIDRDVLLAIMLQPEEGGPMTISGGLPGASPTMATAQAFTSTWMPRRSSTVMNSTRGCAGTGGVVQLSSQRRRSVVRWRRASRSITLDWASTGNNASWPGSTAAARTARAGTLRPAVRPSPQRRLRLSVLGAAIAGPYTVTGTGVDLGPEGHAIYDARQ